MLTKIHFEDFVYDDIFVTKAKNPVLHAIEIIIQIATLGAHYAGCDIAICCGDG
jgi:hypothetical protein